MKTNQEKLAQVKRIMKKLEKRGQNCEKINELYRELLKPTESYHMVIWDTKTGAMYPPENYYSAKNPHYNHPGNVLKDPDFKPNNI